MRRRFVLCINDGGYPESLERRKFYEALEDIEACREGMLRVIDESGEGYLYSKEMFLETTLPREIEEVLEAA